MFKSMMRGFVCCLALAAASSAHADMKKPAADLRFVVEGDKVYDKKTDLTWARCSMGQKWVEGHGCLGSVGITTLAKALEQQKDAWRLPTKAELDTLVDKGLVAAKHQPTINDAAFPDMDIKHLLYWNTAAGAAAGGYTNFGIGRLNKYDLSVLRAVRLVKSGK